MLERPMYLAVKKTSLPQCPEGQFWVEDEKKGLCSVCENQRCR